jgi:hypothetical protein
LKTKDLKAKKKKEIVSSKFNFDWFWRYLGTF